MSATNAGAAKAAIFDRLTETTGPGGPLDGVQVTYRFAPPSTRCVYLGGAPFAHGGGVTSSERDTIDLETVTVGVYVRITVPAGATDVRGADADAELIGGAIHDALSDRPKLPGPDNMHYIGVSGGSLDYALTDDKAIVTLALQLTVASYV